MSGTHKSNSASLNQRGLLKTDFENQQIFMESLRMEQTKAIEYGIELVFRFLRKKFAQADADGLKDIATDTTILAIHKIQHGHYTLRGNKLSTYLITIGLNLYRNESRKRKWNYSELHDGMNQLEDSTANFSKSLEYREVIGKLFHLMQTDCKKLLQLSYFDNLSDKEILERKLLRLKSIGAIKNKRYKCLKDLRNQYSSADISSFI